MTQDELEAFMRAVRTILDRELTPIRDRLTAIVDRVEQHERRELLDAVTALAKRVEELEHHREPVRDLRRVGDRPA